MNLLPAFVGAPEVNRVYHCDLFTLLEAIPAHSVDMILCDLPYGTTACAWDEIIPLVPMWAAFKRVIAPHGAIVLTASQPFTSKLVMSNLEMFKHDIVWHKTQATGHLNAQIEPMREHEDILVFAKGKANYYPQLQPKPAIDIRALVNRGNSTVYGAFQETSPRTIPHDMSYPRSVFRIANVNHGERGLHPTQKPVALFDYLIRTYTQEGDLVLDPTCGSGTTAIAARNTGRRFICGDLDAGYVKIARERLAQPYTPDMFLQAAGE